MIISLDTIRNDLINWADSLWLDGIGAFRNGNSPQPSLKSSLFMTYILYSMDALGVVACDRNRWRSWIQSQQDERDGSFVFPAVTWSRHPQRGHALWNAVRALNMLGGQILRFPVYQRSAMTTTGLKAWFKSWERSKQSHHEVLALVPSLVSHPEENWVDEFFNQLAEQQDKTLGVWPKEKVSISRTFAYSLIHMGVGRLPPQPEKIVDAMLNLQKENEFWEERLGFATMDAVYLLSDLAEKIGWRVSAAKNALHRVMDALIPYYQRHVNSYKGDSHQLLAMVQTWALLSRALPERFITSHVWQFGWNESRFWQSKVIKDQLGRDI